MLAALLLFALPATPPPAASPVVMTGPATCRFAPPADLSASLAAGHPEWIGPCANGKADGLGVVRVADNHGGAQIFYGLLKAGIPIEGLIGDSTGTGYKIVPGFVSSLHIDQSLPAEMQQDPRYWKEAATAAHTAAAHYQAAGNTASAAFYQSQAKILARGPGE